jgi:molybdopterin-guanine dinucleotide biosynthesis protein B
VSFITIAANGVSGRGLILGIYGYQGSGKTTFVESAVSELVVRGYKVASLKHSPEATDVDEEGKDTWRHWKAGSDPVVLMSEDATVLFKRPSMDLSEAISMVGRCFRPDVLIVEGYKEGRTHPKVSIGDIEPTEGTVLQNPTLDRLVEYIVDGVSFERARAKLPGLDCSKCGMDCDGLAMEIAKGRLSLESCHEMPARRVEISVDGKPLPVGAFVAEITESTIRGFLSSLKGYPGGGDVEIRLQATDRSTRNVERKGADIDRGP